MMDLDIEEVAFHRNGICGEGFYAVRFRWQPDDAAKPEAFLAILFDTEGQCAVVGIDRLETEGVRFAGGNSWRGDVFEEQLRQAIKIRPTSGGIRVGPFSVPID